jgi:hypothetical protein
MGYSQTLTADQKWRLFKVQLFLENGTPFEYLDALPATIIADIVSYRDGLARARRG